VARTDLDAETQLTTKYVSTTVTPQTKKDSVSIEIHTYKFISKIFSRAIANRLIVDSVVDTTNSGVASNASDEHTASSPVDNAQFEFPMTVHDGGGNNRVSPDLELPFVANENLVQGQDPSARAPHDRTESSPIDMSVPTAAQVPAAKSLDGLQTKSSPIEEAHFEFPATAAILAVDDNAGRISPDLKLPFVVPDNLVHGQNAPHSAHDRTESSPVDVEVSRLDYCYHNYTGGPGGIGGGQPAGSIGSGWTPGGTNYGCCAQSANG
jgi:hypothetical protein